MLSEREIGKIVTALPVPPSNGAELNDWVYTLSSAIIAAHTAKLLAEVEMPEYKYIDRHDVPKEGMCVYTQDQLQQYAAAAAAQARMEALDEVTDLLREYDMVDSAFGRDVAELKGKQA